MILDPGRKNEREAKTLPVGISMGSALAMILSYDRNHSILYAIVHGLCNMVLRSVPSDLAIEQNGGQATQPPLHLP